MANTNIISDEAFNATKADEEYIFNKMFKSAANDKVYKTFVSRIIRYKLYK